MVYVVSARRKTSYAETVSQLSTKAVVFVDFFEKTASAKTMTNVNTIIGVIQRAI